MDKIRGPLSFEHLKICTYIDILIILYKLCYVATLQPLLPKNCTSIAVLSSSFRRLHVDTATIFLHHNITTITLSLSKFIKGA